MVFFYDSKLKKKVEFKPLVDGKVSFYVCGPTVYDLAHVGHGRSAVSFDIIRRYFIYLGFDVKFVSNFTDIEDKMIKRAARDGISVPELADKIIPEYDSDYSKLGVMKPTLQPKATEYIDEMLELIGVLFKKGYAYLIDGDGVYFDVCKFDKYGELSGQKLEDLQVGCRVAANDGKRNPYDFALWKMKKDGEPFWASEWGDGRPGWHIECSAMTKATLGKSFDFHGGGRDLLFPHHECEVAQSVCAYGEGTYAQNWIHNGFINVDNEKMSKSLGNFFTLQDVFEKFSPRAVRYMFLQTHYRKPINFSDKALEQAEAALKRIDTFVRLIFGMNILDHASDVSADFKQICDVFKKEFEFRMSDDFDTSGALGALFILIKEVNVLAKNNTLRTVDCWYLRELLGGGKSWVIDELNGGVDSVLKIIFTEGNLLPEEFKNVEINKLIDDRKKAKDEKNYDLADKIRDDLGKMGVVLKDGSNGTVWYMK